MVGFLKNQIPYEALVIEPFFVQGVTRLQQTIRRMIVWEGW